VEHQIIERVEQHKQESHALFLDHNHTYDQRVAALNFEERFAVVQQAAPEAVGDFRAEAGLGRDELFNLASIPFNRILNVPASTVSASIIRGATTRGSARDDVTPFAQMTRMVWLP
jgi:hypothetical protein